MKRKSFALEAFVNPRILTGFMLCLAAITLGFSALVATASSPVVITVNTLLDEATSGDGLCSLREAINNFNAQTDTTGGDCASGIGPTEINFSVSGTITLGSTLPGISSSAATLTIDGTAQTITISGANTYRVMVVGSGANLTLQNVTVANGFTAGQGGGIYNRGTLNVTNSTFSGNSANSAGGGIYNAGGMLNVTNSTFSNNTAPNPDGGGGIFNVVGTLTVTNSTFSGNSANYAGGIFNLYGTLNVTNSTFSGNSANYAGGGIYNDSGTATLRNTIVANSTSGGNCVGGITDGGGNLSYPDATCPGTNTDPKLAPLADNGGPTQTMALQSGSAAIDAGVPEYDQRGPGFDRVVNGRTDIGAFEVQPASTAVPSAPTATAATSVTSSSFTANWTSVSGATGYRLDVAKSSSFMGGSFVTGYHNLNVGNVTSRSVTGLSANTTYYYRVRAFNVSGTSSNSNVITVTTNP